MQEDEDGDGWLPVAPSTTPQEDEDDNEGDGGWSDSGTDLMSEEIDEQLAA